MYKYLLTVLCFLASTSTLANYDEAMKEYNLKHYTKAVKLLENASDNGDFNARYLLAKMLSEGQGVPRNAKKSFELMSSMLVDLNNEINQLNEKVKAAEFEMTKFKTQKVSSNENTSRVGEKVCRTGVMHFTFSRQSCGQGTCVYENMSHEGIAPDAQVTANIEKVSDDGKRIQVRIQSWWSEFLFKNKDPNSIRILDTPMLDKILRVKPNEIAWENEVNWSPCY